MKSLNHNMWAIILLPLLFSCGGGERAEQNKPAEQEVPKALQDNKLAIKNYSRSGDLTEELYQELVEKTPLLKNFENDLAAFTPKPFDLHEKFNQYHNKSNNYYSSANYKATAISDSLLRMKIIALIANSGKKYAGKTAELNSLINTISNNGLKLDDQHIILKIALTLPLIEKYQEENKPSTEEFKDLINAQEKLIWRADSLMPKN